MQTRGGGRYGLWALWALRAPHGRVIGTDVVAHAGASCPAQEGCRQDDEPLGRSDHRLLVFQPVAEPKPGKVRLHLDVSVDDVDEGVVVVMADPEGHEFCLVQYY
ncbi:MULTISPECIES: VOC family protein [unclassified Streptomyces]|uniref:VOC family protein n=1 Tax=unclassified Streptomyces TaxID=2593676 RepID=UPI002E34761D|nr:MULTISPECIES: VOC family protein [unclassified Streptomyces]